jgi:hypothetical protein
MERLFWAGATNSLVQRNLAQGIALLTDYNWTTYETTVNLSRVQKLMDNARSIRPPSWPRSFFGEPNQALVPRGKELFVSRCLGCHDPKLVDPAHPDTQPPTRYNYENAGTDDTYYQAQVEPFPQGGGNLMTVLTTWLSRTQDAAIKREQLTPAAVAHMEEGRPTPHWGGPEGQPAASNNAIQAMPLFGIWATPPFLHNGSVQSIRELLTKPAQRKTVFWVGSMVYDPKDLGFVSDDKLYYVSKFDTRLPGNGNQGHEWGTDLVEADKDALIEFLKAYDFDDPAMRALTPPPSAPATAMK